MFYKIFRSTYNFCIYEISSFYLDILKDRLYTFGKDSEERKSCQTVLYGILVSLLKLLAPILVFTTEEAYAILKEELYTPCGLSIEPSIHLADFPDIEEGWIDPKLAKIWDTLIAVRKDVLKPIELLREQKIIRHSLESVVHIYAAEEIFDLLRNNREELAPLFVVSEVHLHKNGKPGDDAHQGELVSVEVKKSTSNKCKRCWRYEENVGQKNRYPDLCERCIEVI